MAKLAINGGTPVRSEPYPRWPQWDTTERDALLGVLDSGRWWATEGDKVPAFERAWARYTQTRRCVAVTNGTHALEVALLGCGVGDGDEVIVTDYTFFASASAVACVNATPVLVDVDPGTYCIDPAAVAAAITPRTRAIVAVHLAGHPADLDALTAICAKYGLALIEDCAHAHGSSWNGTPVGGFGAAGTWSFQQSKLLTAGEGGAVTLQDVDSAARVRSFVDCGRRPGEWFYSHFALGGNYRMTEWQGAVLLAQLERFPEQHRNRNENALYLNGELAKLPGVHPQARDQRTTAQGYYCYVVRIDEAEFGASRDAVKDALAAEGIPLTASYPTVHSLDAFAVADGLAPRHRGSRRWPDYRSLDLPVARTTAATTLWLKHQVLMGSRADADAVVEALAKIRANAAELGC
ncbi:MAG TPA: DegT/DnrJ/EryC1/StrS family aminotransferase [Pseudomonadales bacterium]|nr:DegT/DnrJ/EryC1/StrS family aminotransferase [Pseudomonadales bacterium]